MQFQNIQVAAFVKGSHVNLLEEKENLTKLMASGRIGRMMVNDKI
jgi:hypothetical protein